MRIFISILFFCMLVSCQHPNRFHDARFQQLITWQDERNTEQLLKFLEDEDPEFRAQAAIGLSYIDDKQSIAALLKKAGTDPDADVREAAFFSLGQLKNDSIGDKLTDLFANEKNADVKHAMLVAAGKCGKTEWLKKNESTLNKEFPLFFAKALFYVARAGKLKQEFLPALIELLKENEEICFYAASAISRGSVSIDVDQLKIIQELTEKTDNVDTKIVLTKCLSKAGSKSFPFLNTLFSKSGGNENYLLRVSLLKAVTGFSSDTAALLMIQGLKDANFHVRETVAEWCLKEPAAISAKTRISISRTETFPRIKYYLLQSIIKEEDAKINDSLSLVIKDLYKKEKDYYIQGYQLKALSGNFKNISFIEEETFSTPDIIVRESGFEALLQMRTDKRFPAFAQQWNKSSASVSLERHFASLIRNAIETEDVGLISLAAAFLRDTTLPGYTNGKLPVTYDDIGFMKKVIERIHLPRDIEAFGELLQTIRFYEGKPTEGRQKPDFNNPINWEIVERIPDDQEVEIETSEGVIRLELWVNEAPGTVCQFIKLIKEEFYADKRIHRVVPAFVIQDGCPRGDGYGSAEQTIRSEFSNRDYEAGTLGMASSGPDTESCQWFITHTRTPHLNGRYTAFGKVIKGMDVVHKLAVGAKVREIRLVGK